MYRRMNLNRIWVPFSKPIDWCLAAVRRSIVGYPKYTICWTVWLLLHDQINQLVVNFDTGAFCTQTEDFCSLNIPGCYVCQSPGSLVFKLNALTLARTGSRMKTIAISGLNAGFFIWADYIIIWPQPFSVPESLIEIQNTGGLLGKVRITWKDPTTILPRLYSIGAQPAPNRSTANRGNNAAVNSFAGNISIAEPRKGDVSFARQLASQGFNLHNDFRGENGLVSRTVDDLGGRSVVFQKTAYATCWLFPWANRVYHRFVCFRSHRRQEELIWHGLLQNTVTYIFVPFAAKYFFLANWD